MRERRSIERASCQYPCQASNIVKNVTHLTFRQLLYPAGNGEGASLSALLCGIPIRCATMVPLTISRKLRHFPPASSCFPGRHSWSAHLPANPWRCRYPGYWVVDQSHRVRGRQERRRSSPSTCWPMSGYFDKFESAMGPAEL